MASESSIKGIVLRVCADSLSAVKRTAASIYLPLSPPAGWSRVGKAPLLEKSRLPRTTALPSPSVVLNVALSMLQYRLLSSQPHWNVIKSPAYAHFRAPAAKNEYFTPPTVRTCWCQALVFPPRLCGRYFSARNV